MAEQQTVRRIIAPTYGDPSVLELVEGRLALAGPGEVTIEVRASGMNPTDYKGVAGAYGTEVAKLPLPVGHEVAGLITAIGDGTEIASGGGAVGDAVLAFRVPGGYASAVTVPAADVFRVPEGIDFVQAANLLLVGTTAADMLRVVSPAPGSTILVHGASGAVGVSVLQQAAVQGVRVIGTASPERFEVVERFGGLPVHYGEGLRQRVLDLAPEGVAAALDCVGTNEAVDVSLGLAPTREKVVTIAAHHRVEATGILAVGGTDSESKAFRDHIRGRIIELASTGELVVPVARTYPLEQAAEALAFLAKGHPGGKLALIP